MKAQCMFLLFAISLTFSCTQQKDNQDALDVELISRNNKAVGFMGQFDYDSAFGIYKALTAQYPDNIEVKINYAISQLNRNQKGDVEQALNLINQIRLDSPNNIRANYIEGILRQYIGEVEKANVAFRRVLEQTPSDPYAMYFLAQGLAQLNQHEDALFLYQKAAAINPYIRSVFYGAFQASQKLKRRELAKKYLTSFQDLKGNPRAELIEIKYTRMGPLAEVITLDNPTASNSPTLNGSLFSDPKTHLRISARTNNTNYEEATNVPSITAMINQNAAQTIFVNHKGNSSTFRTNKEAFQPIFTKTALDAVSNVNTSLWGDYDNDGLSDIFLLRNGKNQLWKNIGDGKFKKLDLPIVESASKNSIDGAFFDADHDGDLDIFVINQDGPNELLNNNLNDSFRSLTNTLVAVKQENFSKGVLVFDFDNDRDTDIFVINQKPPHLAYQNDRLWRYQEAPGFTNLLNSDIQVAIAADFDSDGVKEILTQTSEGKIFSWKNKNTIWSSTEIVFDSPPAKSNNPKLAALDLNGNGKLELLSSSETGWSAYQFDEASSRYKRLYTTDSNISLLNWTPLVNHSTSGPSIVGIDKDLNLIEWAPGSGRFPFATLTLSGKENSADAMRSNASGIGTKVAARNGSSWTIVDSFRSDSGPGQSLQPIAIGLGQSKSLDFIALEWTDGVYQTELNITSGLHRLTETQRQLASCPVLFAWNGSKFEFVSDIIGVGGLGFAIGPDEYATPRPWENFLIPEDTLVSKNGYYQFVISEPMEEVMYLDYVELEVYDLPESMNIALDERMGVNAPLPTGKTLVYSNPISPSRAYNGLGENIFAEVSQQDHIAAPVGQLDNRFIGLTKSEHSLIIEFEQPVDNRGTPTLIIDGWVEYPYSQTSFAAWQANASYNAATLSFKLPNGQWEVLYDQFGYPAGMPRQMTLPLKGLPPGVTQLKLSSNMEIYWDRIQLAYTSPIESDTNQSLVEVNAIQLANAEALETGFALRTTGKQRLPHYDYDKSAPLWDTRHPSGFYTRFGEVTELLERQDSALAIIGPGEGVRIKFPEVSTPVKQGWKRFFVLKAKGWVKDMDMYTKDGETVAPLPGKETPERKALHDKYNVRLR